MYSHTNKGLNNYKIFKDISLIFWSAVFIYLYFSCLTNFYIFYNFDSHFIYSTSKSKKSKLEFFSNNIPMCGGYLYIVVSLLEEYGLVPNSYSDKNRLFRKLMPIIICQIFEFMTHHAIAIFSNSLFYFSKLRRANIFKAPIDCRNFCV